MHQLTNLFIISEISYTLHLRVETGVLRCHGLMMRREGVEFAMRSSTDTTWIPLQLTYFSDSDSTVTEVIRGHSVTVTGSTSADIPRQVFVCSDLLRVSNIQFRWMSTAYIVGGEANAHADMWAISSVSANLVNDNGTIPLFTDSFGSVVLK